MQADAAELNHALLPNVAALLTAEHRQFNIALA
jgi:hypothetical protein